MQERLYNQIIYSNKLITKTFRKGEILFFQDDCPTHSYIVKKGKIRLYTQNEKNETMTIFQYNQKDHCPISILSLLSGKPTIATAEVLEDTEVYIVTKKMLNELLLNNATYQQYVFQDIFLVTNMLRTLLEEASFMSKKERLLAFLKRQSSQVIRITHNTISNEIGTNRVVVSRILKELEQEGHLELQRGKIVLNSRFALSA